MCQRYSTYCYVTVGSVLSYCFIQKVFEFWMFKGVDGFRMDAVRHLYEDSNLQDEQPSKKDNTMPVSEN